MTTISGNQFDGKVADKDAPRCFIARRGVADAARPNNDDKRAVGISEEIRDRRAHRADGDSFRSTAHRPPLKSFASVPMRAVRLPVAPCPGMQVSTHCSGASGGPPSAIPFLGFIRLVRRRIPAVTERIPKVATD